MWMNEHDVNDRLRDFHPSEVPNLAEGAQVLANLVYWTNANSDGWPYWPKPSNAAKSLIAMLDQAKAQYYRGGEVTDVTEAELKKALRPIKAFLTRQGVNQAEVFGAQAV